MNNSLAPKLGQIDPSTPEDEIKNTAAAKTLEARADRDAKSKAGVAGAPGASGEASEDRMIKQDPNMPKDALLGGRQGVDKSVPFDVPDDHVPAPMKRARADIPDGGNPPAGGGPIRVFRHQGDRT